MGQEPELVKPVEPKPLTEDEQRRIDRLNARSAKEVEEKKLPKRRRKFFDAL